MGQSNFRRQRVIRKVIRLFTHSVASIDQSQSLLLPSFPIRPFPTSLPSFRFPSSQLPSLRSRPLKSSLGFGERHKLPKRSLEQSPSRNLVHYSLIMWPSVGNNFNQLFYSPLNRVLSSIVLTFCTHTYHRR